MRWQVRRHRRRRRRSECPPSPDRALPHWLPSRPVRRATRDRTAPPPPSATPRWSSSDSIPSFGAGRPTTGMRCPRGCSTSWTPTCGSSPTSGRVSLIRTRGTLDHLPVLRRVQLIPARSVGVRRPRQRRLPDQVRLDEDHPAHVGQGLGVPGRPGLSRLLGGPATSRETPAGPGPVTAPPQPAWTLPALRRAAAPRRGRAATPRRLGTVDHSDQQGDPSPRDHPRFGTRDTAGTHCLPSHPHALPTPSPRRHRQ